MVDLPADFVEYLKEYPDDRDLKRYIRRFKAAQGRGKLTKPIVKAFNSRVALLQNGGKISQ